MGQETKISWCNHTFNPWEGCQKVSPGCANCYAEERANRFGTAEWGPHGTRRVAAESYWKQPLKWNAAAAKAGERRTVFCASLADVFEDWQGPMSNAKKELLMIDGLGAFRTDVENVTNRPWRCLTMDDVRERLFETIAATPALTWLLLTKRPENILPTQERLKNMGLVASGQFPWSNIRYGTSVENQDAANKRIPELLKVPAAGRFLSMEPLLEPVNLSPWMDIYKPKDASGSTCDQMPWSRTSSFRIDKFHWVIVGGESGSKARTFELDWARSIRDQCKAVGVAFWMKQMGADPVSDDDRDAHHSKDPTRYALRTILFKDGHGADMEEWPEDLRIQELPR